MALVDLFRTHNGGYILNATKTPVGEVNVEIVVNSSSSIFTGRYSPKTHFFWNAFGDEKIYIDLPAGKKLTLHSNMQSLFSGFYSAPNFSPGHFYVTNPDSLDNAWAFRYKNEQYNGWMISKALFFEYFDDFSSVGVCSHFTGLVSGLYIRSKNYSFANTIPYSTCSHPDLADKAALPFISCAYESNHANCPYYSFHSETISSKSVADFMNENYTVYSLTVSMSLSGGYTYQIIRLSDKEVNYSMPVDSRTQETDAKAIEVFEEMLSSYEDGFKTVTEFTLSEPQTQKNSFILSLV